MTVRQRQTAPFAQMTKGAASALGDGKEGGRLRGRKKRAETARRQNQYFVFGALDFGKDRPKG